MDTRLLEEDHELETIERSRGDFYRLRRASASRRRSRSGQKKTQIPGSIRQRRNKHWNW
jgi:hypothetical protein